MVAILCKSEDLGELISDKEDKPWESKKQLEITVSDYPENIEVVRSNMLYIPTKDLSASMTNKIKHLAAFKKSRFLPQSGYATSYL